MFKVNYSVTIGSGTFSSSSADFLISLTSCASLDVPVNSCSIVLAYSSDVTVASGDAVTVKLGYDNEATVVFTGVVYALEVGLETIRIQALSSFTGLTTTYCNLMYEQSAAGTIIEDFFSMGSVTAGTVEPGMTLAVYDVCDHYSLYDEAKKLALYNGLDLFADKDDKGQCKTFMPASPVMCQYGSTILSFSTRTNTAVRTGTEIYGESPVGQGQGDDAVSWLTKKDVKGEDGDTSGYTKRIFEPGARNTNNAGTIAKNIMTEAKKIDFAQAVLLGDAALELTGTVLISGMPDSAADATYKIRGVSHRLSPVKGFTTCVDLEKLS